MNAEIYLLRGGSAASQCGSDAFNKQMKALSEHNICVLYKTAVDNNEQSLKKALDMSLSDEEGIDFIVVADALEQGTKENAEEFFAKFQVKKDNITEIITNISDNDNEATDKKEVKKTFNVYSARVGGKNGIRVLLLPKVESVDEDFSDIVYKAIYSSFIENKPKKGGFFKNFIPMKGDKPLEIVRKSILIAAILTFIVSGYLLVDQLVIKPMIADNTNSGIKELLTEGGGGSSNDDNYGAVTPKKKKIVIGESDILPDFQKLLNENKDTVGWIKIPNTQVDYVVCQSQDPDQPEYYLKRDFYGNYSDYGTVFLDYRSPLDAKNLILHGHHMNDGRMFANVMYYQDLNFYKETPAFTFNTIYEKSKWKIISIYKTNTLDEHGEFFNYLRGTFETESDFMNYIYQVRARSIFNCPVDVNEDDTIITLSTCCYDFDQFRFVVVARKVREGETAKVDTSDATYNSNVVYPDVWYKANGGKKPVLTNFEEAFAKGELSWYKNPHKKKWKVSDAQKEAAKIAEKKRKEQEEKEKQEEASRRQAEKDEKLKLAKAELENANTYIEVAKSNFNSANDIFNKIKNYSEIARKDSISSVSNAKKNILKAKTEKELNGIIQALQNAKNGNSNVIKQIDSISEWSKAVIEQSDTAAQYADDALKYTADVKKDVQSIKDKSEKYKKEMNSIVKNCNNLSAKAEERNGLIDIQIANANEALKKIRNTASVIEPSNPESSTADPDTSNTEPSGNDRPDETAGNAA